MSTTNVMAFEDYNYEANQYERYAMDMANDNYYKSQDMDIIKKIKCNNINNNLNGDDNTVNLGIPLEPGAASLQGDGTSPYWFGNGERNGNGNFDLDCINNNDNAEDNGNGTGSQGPAGPQGPRGLQGERGPAGPAGPAGLNQISNTNLYTVLGEVARASNGAGIAGNSTAVCDEGDVVIEGGYILRAGNPTQAPIVQSNGPLPNPVTRDSGTADSAYSVTLLSTSSAMNTDFQTYAYCFDNPPAHVEMAAAVVSTFQQQLVDSPVISQGIKDSPKLTALAKQPENSPGLTATEKTTKLKQQWLNLLP
jgi:hypothetical protein